MQEERGTLNPKGVCNGMQVSAGIGQQAERSGRGDSGSGLLLREHKFKFPSSVYIYIYSVVNMVPT